MIFCFIVLVSCGRQPTQQSDTEWCIIWLLRSSANSGVHTSSELYKEIVKTCKELNGMVKR